MDNLIPIPTKALPEGARVVDGVTMLTSTDYTDFHGVSFRSVKRWVQANEIPGAISPEQSGDGKWWIPADSIRRPGGGGASSDVAVSESNSLATLPGVKELSKMPTLKEYLDHEPAYLPIETAARLLGITEYALRAHKDEYGAVPRGDHGSLVVPQVSIRRAAGN